MSGDKLACGHDATPRGLAAGYARTPHTDARICYACAATAERVRVLDSPIGERVGAYLSTDGRTMTVWTGEPIMRVVSESTGRRTLFGEMVYVTATDGAGHMWRGSSGNGRGGAVTMRRTR